MKAAWGQRLLCPPMEDFQIKVRKVSSSLWSKSKFGDIPRRIKELRERASKLYDSFSSDGITM